MMRLFISLQKNSKVKRNIPQWNDIRTSMFQTYFAKWILPFDSSAQGFDYALSWRDVIGNDNRERIDLQQIESIIKAMNNHFTFGHTIVIEDNEEESSEGLDGLFKIGDKKIEIKEDRDDDSESDKTVKQKGIKKEKRDKKDKKEKHDKKGKKQKKEKKEKHKKNKGQREAIQIESDDSSQNDRYRQLQLYSKTEQAEKLEKYKGMMRKTLQEEVQTKQFELNIRVGEGLLNVDIIKLPQQALYLYGHMDKDIPRYSRLDNFNQIIGIKPSKQKKYQHIVKDLNKVINQKVTNPYEDEISKNRYFDYQGYESCGLERLGPEERLHEESFLRFSSDDSRKFNEDDRSLLANKQFNRSLNENPHNIDMWLEFVNVQDAVSQSIGSLKNKSAIIDRKISILQKSLNHNPFNERIGLLYLSMLFMKQLDSKAIISKCLQFIHHNPASVPLWKLYFSLHIQQFNIFSHAYIRKTFQEMNQLFKTIIQSTKSAVEIWKIRKASLEILKQTLLLYKLEGYNELATGLIVALIEYNIFMPDEVIQNTNLDQKLKAFVHYWQEYNIYKLGEIDQKVSWCKRYQKTEEKAIRFIRDIESFDLVKSAKKNKIMQEIDKSRKIWRPSNAHRDKDIIEKYPESFVLIDDIDHALLLYRDAQSLNTLLQTLADHLQMPLIFNATSIYSQFNYKLVECTLHRYFTTKSQETITFDSKNFFWSKYWNPQHTELVIPAYNFIKLQYLKRVLLTAKERMPAQQSKMNEYICFISCSLYINSALQQTLNITPEQSLRYIQEILIEQPFNLSVWSMYIEATYTLKRNLQQCINCYIRLFETVKILIQDVQEQMKLNYQILFWLYSFNWNNKLNLNRKILKIYLRFVNKQEIERVELGEELNSFDCLRLEQHFSNHLTHLLSSQRNMASKDTMISDKTRVGLFMIAYLETYPLSTLRAKQNDLVQYFISLVLKDYKNQSNNQQFILWMLTQSKLLTFEHITTFQLLKQTPFLSIIQYWISLYQKPLILFQGYFDQLPKKSLILWMSSIVFLWKRANLTSNFHEFFYNYSKQICLQDQLAEQHPQYMILLSSLLLYDVNERHNSFIFSSLKHLPYSKELYLNNLLIAESETEKKKLKAIIEEKCIRILDQTLLL